MSFENFLLRQPLYLFEFFIPPEVSIFAPICAEIEKAEDSHRTCCSGIASCEEMIERAKAQQCCKVCVRGNTVVIAAGVPFWGYGLNEQSEDLVCSNEVAARWTHRRS
jgi:hypothetical protein